MAKKKDWKEVTWVIALTLFSLQVGVWTTNAWVARKTADMRANITQAQKDLKDLRSWQKNLSDRLEYLQREQATAYCEVHPEDCDRSVELQVAPAPAAQATRGPV